MHFLDKGTLPSRAIMAVMVGAPRIACRRFAARRTADYFFLVLRAQRATRAPRFHARVFLPPNIPGPD
jgi:hypothetical protein